MEQRRRRGNGTPDGARLESTPYTSVLLHSRETLYWNIHNLHELVELKCWTAVSIRVECRGSLGRNYIWRLTLTTDEEDIEILYGRVSLIEPINYTIPYNIKFTHLNPSESQGTPEVDLGVREISSSSKPQIWKILDLKRLSRTLHNQDLLRLKVDLTTYGSETTRGFDNIQNYPY